LQIGQNSDASLELTDFNQDADAAIRGFYDLIQLLPKAGLALRNKAKVCTFKTAWTSSSVSHRSF